MLNSTLYVPNTARPHVIRCLIHRSKIDCNRDWLEATFGLAGVNITWYEFHHFTHHARNAATAGGTRRAFYIDVHGQVNWNTRSISATLTKTLSVLILIETSEVYMWFESINITWASLFLCGAIVVEQPGFICQQNFDHIFRVFKRP